MSTNTSATTNEIPEFLPGFKPADVLLAGPNPLFPSRASLNWAVTQLRTDLIAAQALAYVRGRLLIHPARLNEVRERAALRSAANRSSIAV